MQFDIIIYMVEEKRTYQEPLPKCTPIPLASMEQIRSDIKSIRSLIPSPGLPAEERAVNNTQMRELLPYVSNEALLTLRTSHLLSGRELTRRLQGHQPFAPESLANALAQAADIPFGLPKGERTFYGLVLQNLAEILPETEQERAVEVLRRVYPNGGRPNGPVIEYLLRLCKNPTLTAEQLAKQLNDEPVIKAIIEGLSEEIKPEILAYVEFFLGKRELNQNKAGSI